MGSHRIRLLLLLMAMAAIGVAVFLWLSDGAWQYGAMPTKGVIRTALFGGVGCALIVAAGWLSPKQ